MKNQKSLGIISLVLGAGVLILLILYWVLEKQAIFMELGLMGLGAINIVNGIAKWKQGKQRMGLTIIVFGLILGVVAIFTIITKYIA